MKLISIELYLYKPLMHNGVKHLTVDDMSTITVIAGENGSGKSSLLRECTPYPACRTDYDKGGYKKVVYVHNQKVYTLTSDFRKPNGAHSFLDGDVELNNSGTTEVQEELAASTFGLTDTIRKLISGKYKICDMGKPERKSLIMSTYPSSMSFILDHYKAISSNLRSVLANLKMMLQREQSLRNQMMTTSLLETCVNQRADLNRALTAIDMDVYAIRQAVDHAASSLGNVTEQNLYTEKHEIDELAADLIRQYQQVTGQNTTAIPNSSDIDAELLELDTSIGILKADIQGKTDAAYEIKEEVSRYTDYLNNDSKSNLEECVRLITVQDDIIRNTPLDERFPVLSEEELEYLEKWVPNWVEKIDTLQTMILESKAKEAPTQEAYDKADKEFNDLLQVRSKAEDLAVRLSEDLKRLESRREYQMQHTWPSDCKMLCTLKDNMKTILAQVDDDIRMTRVELEKQNRIVLDTEDRLNTLAEGLQDARPQRGIITYLEGCFFLHSWADFVTNGRSLTEALNSDAIGIRNTLLKLVDNGRNALKVKTAKAMKTVLEAKKVGLENSSAPAENIIRESLVKSEAKLATLTADIQRKQSDMSRLTGIRDRYIHYQNLVDVARSLIERHRSWAVRYKTFEEIQFFRNIVNNLLMSRGAIQTKLRELDTIVREQEALSIRLNQEVLPEIEKLKGQRYELSVLERQLNPTKGIPHLYTTRYINSVLSLANKFIARVWSYPMEIQYIADDNEAFDYSFPLLLNGATSIKDINMASAGQQAIINLCFTLAICIFRQYTLMYPLILDEVTVNLSIQHQNNLVLFINELLAQNDQILQVLLVDHCIDVCSSFTSIAEMVCLSPGMDIDAEWKRIGTTE